MASYLGSYTGEESDDEDGRNSPTSSPCELTYNNLFNRVNCLSTTQVKECTETQQTVKTTRTHQVTRQWPRDPQRDPITLGSSLEGKQASNGLPLWGGTMSDLHQVQNSPRDLELETAYTISTGSHLSKWMKESGELQWGVREPDRAGMENDPQIRLWNVWNAIEEQEHKIRSRSCGWGKPMKKTGEDNTGIFKSSNFPAPWPLVPFSYPTEKLQHRIQYSGLPRKLVIHDPWQLLTIPQDHTNADVPWSDMSDITTVYRLEVPEKGGPSAVETVPQVHISNVDSNHRELQGFFLDPLQASVKPITPPIYVVYPPQTSTPIPEAHVYLSPTHTAGRGTHSRAYYVELELPCDALAPSVMCKECVREDIMAKLKEEDGSDGERMDEKWKTKSTTVEIVENTNCGHGVPTVERNPRSIRQNQTNDCTVQSVPGASHIQITGPIRRIRTTVSWRNVSHPANCGHLEATTSNVMSTTESRPPTAKVRVIAKLYHKGDELLDEARNYQEFAPYLFEHSTGFNLISPLLDPVPVGAVMPQFYGFYVPKSCSDEGSQMLPSSILLLEDCGTPISTDNLSFDNSQECTALYHRLHNSVVRRKILVQPGLISSFPRDRKPDPTIPAPKIMKRAVRSFSMRGK